MKYIHVNSLNNMEFPLLNKICGKFAKRYIKHNYAGSANKYKGMIDLYAEFDDDVADEIFDKFKSVEQTEYSTFKNITQTKV